MRWSARCSLVAAAALVGVACSTAPSDRRSGSGGTGEPPAATMAPEAVRPVERIVPVNATTLFVEVFVRPCETADATAEVDDEMVAVTASVAVTGDDCDGEMRLSRVTVDVPEGVTGRELVDTAAGAA